MKDKEIKAIKNIVEFCYEDEKEDFEMEHDTEVINTDELEDLERQIEWIENESDNGTDHVFYSILILKRALLESNY